MFFYDFSSTEQKKECFESPIRQTKFNSFWNIFVVLAIQKSLFFSFSDSRWARSFRELAVSLDVFSRQFEDPRLTLMTPWHSQRILENPFTPTFRKKYLVEKEMFYNVFIDVLKLFLLAGSETMFLNSQPWKNWLGHWLWKMI